MKKIIYVVMLFVFQMSIAQQSTTVPTQEQADNNVYNSAGIEVKPEYPGGLAAFYSHISKNYLPPNVKGLKGRVIVSFVVEKDGSLADFKILKDVGYGSGEEAIRVLKLCERWTPATQLGVPVRCSYQLPINIETEKENKTHSKSN